MEDKKAAEILIKMIDSHALAGEEKEAVLAAVGVLSWTSLAKSRIGSLAKNRKAKREKDSRS